MPLKVYLPQTPALVPENTGIGRVIHAQYRYLPQYDIVLTNDADGADLRIAHANGTKIRDLDILMCHGLYWTGDLHSGSYAPWHYEINGRILHDARRARAITVPSDWVAEPFRRDMRISPHIIGHGIELDQWKPAEPRGYILWNKNRAADVCDPTPAWDLAMHGERVISTFAPAGKSVPQSMQTIGQLPHNQMAQFISHAAIYLATTKETFGIGTLEAMACGVPILGYRWGGTADLVVHQVNGYLVDPGDTEGLREGAEYIRQHRAELSRNAREQASVYSWPTVMAKYAALFYSVADQRASEEHSVSIVITSYNYAQYVGEAIESCLNQTIKPKEILVIDDGSTDGTYDVLDLFRDHPLVSITHQQNQGVAAARNNGISQATSPYIICLDADDRLSPYYIEALLPAMKQDRGLGIAYTGLGFIHPDGQSISPGRWPIAFDWEIQSRGGVPPSNCIPAAAMFRKSMWERAGGYRQEYAPGEDAEFWTRGLSVGFSARKVMDDPFFHYRAHTGSASRTKTYVPINTWHPWMADRLYPMAAPSSAPPLVRSYSQPVVSVIAPSSALVAELASWAEQLLGQTVREWEFVAPGGMLRDKRLDHYPFIKYNPSGLLHLELKPGEQLEPTTLEELLMAYVESEGKAGKPRLKCKEKTMAKSCCGGAGAALTNKTNTVLAAQLRPVTVVDTPDAPVEDGKVRMEFIGQRQGAITYKGEDLRRQYRGGNNSQNRFIDAHPDDVAKLLRSGDWKLLKRAAKPEAKAAQPEAEPVKEESVPEPTVFEAAMTVLETPAPEVPKGNARQQPKQNQQQRGRRK